LLTGIITDHWTALKTVTFVHPPSPP